MTILAQALEMGMTKRHFFNWKWKIGFTKNHGGDASFRWDKSM